MLLETKELEVSYGNVQIIWGVDINVNHSEIVSIVGANAAGKTTLLKSLCGLLTGRGKIYFLGEDISNTSVQERVSKGIVYIPEGKQLFRGLTVKQNIISGAYLRSDKNGIIKDMEFIISIFPELEERASQLCGGLSGGEQQMCVLARGLMSRPKLLLVDELSWGLAPLIVKKLHLTLTKVADENNVSILLVEQDVGLALRMSKRCYVLENGRIIKEGESDSLINDEQIKKAYMGI